MATFVDTDMRIIANHDAADHSAPRTGFRTADYGLAGYLLALGFAPSVERNGRQVVFCFPSSAQIATAVGDYTSNRPVPCRDFFHGLRKAKSMIQEKIRSDHECDKR